MQLNKFSPAAQKVLIETRALAKKYHNHLVEPEHLALALVTTVEVEQLLKKKNLNHKSLTAALVESVSKLHISLADEPSFSGRLIQALSGIQAFSISKNHETISISDMLLSLIENKNKYGSLGAILGYYFLDEQKENTVNADKERPSFYNFVEPLNQKIREQKLDPVFGRDQEGARIVQILSRKNRNNPLLIGEPGVGRTSIIYALVKKINAQEVPSFLITKEILSLDVGALVAGTTLRGQFEERLQKVLHELSEESGKYILFVRDISSLIGAGGEGASDAANLIMPRLLKGDIQMIGLVSPEVYKKRIENNPSFERLFQPLWIEQPTIKECKLILAGLKSLYERFHGVIIDDEALDAAIDLGSKHFSGRVLPEVALDVLDEACARHRIAIDKRPQKLKVIDDQIFALEMETKRKASAKNKSLESKLEKLRTQQKQLEERYNQELSLLESVRALQGQIAHVKDELAVLHEKRDAEQASLLANNQLSALEQIYNTTLKKLEKIKKSERSIEPYVRRDDIAEVVSQETGIPVQKMLASEREKLALLETLLSAKVIGQQNAVTAVAAAIKRARVGLKDQKKPIGSFLFMGPTGVGKTELARTLTSFLFDDERAMVRFDMSEFMERHSVARLIGAPPGYQGSDDGGQLTETIRHKPFSVILFDEIEKAHADVLNILLQVLDEGRLTDSKGRLVHFNNTVVIMTSNVGADILLEEPKKTPETIKEMLMERLLGFLRPELINRIDEVVVFEALDKNICQSIVDLMIDNLQQRLHDEGYEINVEKAVKDYLLKEGYNREFGARPLKRALQRLIETPLAQALVEARFSKGDHITISLGKGQIQFLSGNKP